MSNYVSPDIEAMNDDASMFFNSIYRPKPKPAPVVVPDQWKEHNFAVSFTITCFDDMTDENNFEADPLGWFKERFEDAMENIGDITGADYEEI